MPLLAVALLLVGGWGLLTVWLTTPSLTASAPIPVVSAPPPSPIASLPTLPPKSPTPEGPATPLVVTLDAQSALSIVLLTPTNTPAPTPHPQVVATKEAIAEATMLAKARDCNTSQGGMDCFWPELTPTPKPTPTPLPICQTPVAGQQCFKPAWERMTHEPR